MRSDWPSRSTSAKAMACPKRPPASAGRSTCMLSSLRPEKMYTAPASLPAWSSAGAPTAKSAEPSPSISPMASDQPKSSPVLPLLTSATMKTSYLWGGGPAARLSSTTSMSWRMARSSAGQQCRRTARGRHVVGAALGRGPPSARRFLHLDQLPHPHQPHSPRRRLHHFQLRLLSPQQRLARARHAPSRQRRAQPAHGGRVVQLVQLELQGSVHVAQGAGAQHERAAVALDADGGRLVVVL